MEEWKTINRTGVAPITCTYKYRNYVLSISTYYDSKAIYRPPKLFSATLYEGKKLIKTWYGVSMQEFEADLMQLCQQLKIPYPFD
jgi:hypothetical protein